MAGFGSAAAEGWPNLHLEQPLWHRRPFEMARQRDLARAAHRLRRSDHIPC